MNDELQNPEDLTPETAADLAEGAAMPQVPLEEEVMQLRAALAQRDNELAEQKNTHLRALADFDNFRKRMRAERDQEFARGSERVLADLLPILDDFERALAAAGECPGDPLHQGVELIYRQLQGLLERYGITPMEVEGQPFDPMYHDAVARLASAELPEHTIVGVVQRGYLKNGDVFRPAKVAVSVTTEA